MKTNGRLGQYFSDRASSFDSIYMSHKGLIRQVWDRLTRQNIYYRFNFTIKVLSPAIGKTVLDVGCGSGRYCVELAAKGASYVVGIDLSNKMLELAKNLAKNRGVDEKCRFLRKDILEYSTPERFDATIAMGFFDYVQEPERILTHLRTLTRDILVASFPSLGAFRVPFRKIWLALKGCPIRFYTRNEVIKLCTQAGFVYISLIRNGPIYLLIAKPNPDANC